MRRLSTLMAAATALGLLLVVWLPAASQDDTELRIASLETRVAALEARVLPGATPVANTERLTFSGTVTFTTGIDELIPDGSTGCRGERRFVELAADALLPVSHVSDGERVGWAVVSRTTLLDETAVDRRCAFELLVTDVPASQLYVIDLGPIGDVVVIHADLERDGWVFAEEYRR